LVVGRAELVFFEPPLSGGFFISPGRPVWRNNQGVGNPMVDLPAASGNRRGFWCVFDFHE